MKKVTIIGLVLLLSGCVPNSMRMYGLDDNSPTNAEREQAYWRCAGVSKYANKPVPTEVRIACTAAIYGGYKP